jgi:hypothetical protein
MGGGINTAFASQANRVLFPGIPAMLWQTIGAYYPSH